MQISQSVPVANRAAPAAASTQEINRLVTTIKAAEVGAQTPPSTKVEKATQEIKRLVTTIQAAEVGAPTAAKTKAGAAAQEIQRIAAMLLASEAGAPIDTAPRASTGYQAGAAAAAAPDTSKIAVTA